MSSDKNNNVILVIWPSGKATVCKTVIAGSIPVITLIKKVANMATFFYVVNVVKEALVYSPCWSFSAMTAPLACQVEKSAVLTRANLSVSSDK